MAVTDAKALIYASTDHTDSDDLRDPLILCTTTVGRLLPDFGTDGLVGSGIDKCISGSGLLSCGIPDKDGMAGGVAIACDWAGDDGTDGDNNRLALKPLTNPDSSVEHLVVPVGDVIDDRIQPVIDTALEESVEVHVVPVNDGFGCAMSDIVRRRAGPGEEWRGRPPIGHCVEDGHLVHADDYEEVVSVLRLVDNGQLSVRSAADELDCSRRTIDRALTSRKRYCLG